LWEKGSPDLGLSFEKLSPGQPLDQWVPELSGNVTPPRQRPLSTEEQKLLANQVAEWLDQGIIEPRRLRHVINNNIVFAAKANGGVRVCNDCTPVNKVTKDLDWPLLRLQDVRHRTRGANWFTRIDLRNAFFRIRVPPKYRHLTAFSSQGIQYQFRRMPFGVKTGPATYQRFMDHELAQFLAWLLVYIDDLLISGTTLPELRRRTRAVKKRLQEMGCPINEEKSEYEKRGLTFAGIWLTSESVGPNVLKVRDVLATPLPTTKAAMLSALGLVSYLRDFIPLVSLFTQALYPRGGERETDDIIKEARPHWARLLHHIKSAVTSLRHWKEKADADVYADASNRGLGVVLIQNQAIVAVASCTLQEAQTRYSATDREHLALVFAAKKFRIFLHRPEGVTRVHSDHAALIGKRSPDMTPRQERWQTIVNQWMPRVQHVAGKDNPADFFSRWGLETIGGVEKL